MTWLLISAAIAADELLRILAHRLGLTALLTAAATGLAAAVARHTGQHRRPSLAYRLTHRPRKATA